MRIFHFILFLSVTKKALLLCMLKALCWLTVSLMLHFAALNEDWLKTYVLQNLYQNSIYTKTNLTIMQK